MTAPPPVELSNLIIACALKREAQTLRRHLDHAVRVEWTGLGGRRTESKARDLLQKSGTREFWFTGTCGALAPQVEVGQLVLPADWLLPNGETVPNSPELLRGVPIHLCYRADAGLTVRHPVIRPQSRRELHKDTGATICDMESYYALKAAQDCRVPAMAFKVVTDTARSGITDFWRNFDDAMSRVADFCNRLLETRFKSPTRLG